MTKKMIEQYVILDMGGNVVDNIEDINAGVNTLRIYNRETSNTIVKIDTTIAELNLFIAKACIGACNEYSPVSESIEINGGENDGD